MSKSKNSVLLLTFTVMISLTATNLLESPQAAHSQTDYEEYLIVETDTAQELKQKNVGSGESTNVNCGTNIAGTNLAQPITCPDVDEDGDGVLQRPVVTQRVAPSFSTNGGGSIPENWAVSRAACNEDEVVTGGGFEFNTAEGTSLREHAIMERAEDNTWSVYVNAGGTLRAYAECLKLVPS
jgi:hypothetical protein